MMQFVMSQDKTSITPPEAGLQLPTGESHLGDLLTPPFLGRKETTKFPQKKHSIKETLTRLGGEDREMSPAATMGPALCKLSA